MTDLNLQIWSKDPASSDTESIVWSPARLGAPSPNGRRSVSGCPAVTRCTRSGNGSVWLRRRSLARSRETVPCSSRVVASCAGSVPAVCAPVGRSVARRLAPWAVFPPSSSGPSPGTSVGSCHTMGPSRSTRASGRASATCTVPGNGDRREHPTSSRAGVGEAQSRLMGPTPRRREPTQLELARAASGAGRHRLRPPRR